MSRTGGDFVGDGTDQLAVFGLRRFRDQGDGAPAVIDVDACGASRTVDDLADSASRVGDVFWRFGRVR